MWSLGEQGSRQLIKHALDAGINFVDTTNTYSQGSSEEILGLVADPGIVEQLEECWTNLHGTLTRHDRGMILSDRRSPRR